MKIKNYRLPEDDEQVDNGDDSPQPQPPIK